MAKRGPKYRFYAVKNGREGPRVYTTWDECAKNTQRISNAVFKGFNCIEDAEEFIAIMIANGVQPPPAPLLTHVPPATEADIPALAIPRIEPAAVKLSQDQKRVLTRVKKGQSVFFTGSAGTGKSLLMREIIDYKSGRQSRRLGITATTGIAACNIEGTTLHSWSGLMPNTKDGKDLAGKLFGQKMMKNTLERWKETDTLIIDEISMLDGDLFDTLEECARCIRHNDEPFGGIQLIISGDFCQLPPVPDRSGKPMKFAFDAQSWERCMGEPIFLKKVFRQKEQTFVDMLNEMRFGKLNPDTIDRFYKLSRPVTYTDGIEPTGLYSTRMEVNAANMDRLRRLPGPGKVYQARDRSGIDSKGKHVSEKTMDELLEKRTIAPKDIELRIGAQVMLIKNLVQGVLVNGSVGNVTAFRTPLEAHHERMAIAGVQPPEPGMSLGAREKEKFDRAKELQWPVVRFANGRELLCIPAEFTVENADGGMEAAREQIPLIHAWALSVHKSQGQTLERVLVDLRRTFEKGQAYVALSRATRMDQLQVLNFSPDKVRAHPRVLEWYNEVPPQPEVVDISDEDMDEEFDVAFID